MEDMDKLQKQCDDFFERNPDALEKVKRALEKSDEEFFLRFMEDRGEG